MVRLRYILKESFWPYSKGKLSKDEKAQIM